MRLIPQDAETSGRDLNLVCPVAFPSFQTVAINGFLRALDPETEANVTTDYIRRLIHDHVSTIFVKYTGDGVPKGMSTLIEMPGLVGGRFMLADLFVMPEFRGEGDGEDLTVAVIQEAAQRSARVLDLSVPNDSAVARALFEKLGWKPLDTDVYQIYPQQFDPLGFDLSSLVPHAAFD